MRVAVYARFSTDKQDARSIDDQIRRCRAFAEQRGWSVIGSYEDAAQSGSHTDRQNLQRLLRDAGRREFDRVLVDDLSRLSRDLGATWRIIFEDLAADRVHVVDCTTGRASNEPGARLIFGALGLVNDTYLELIRTETHRGLEGRALAGFATGGRTYGFRTVPEPNPTDVLHPRKVRVVHPDESTVVQRIFESFADGQGTKDIAAALNDDGIAAPHDGGRGNKLSRGWGHTTIRHMLRNENYRGVFTWNRHRFEQIPGTNRYRHVPRPPEEHIRKEFPELRIVSEELWNRVQQAVGAKRTPHTARLGMARGRGALLSGLLKCGVCGGSYVLVSRRIKGGAAHSRLGCGVARSRGKAICANDRSILASQIEDRVLGCIRQVLSQPDLMDQVVKGFGEYFAESAKTDELRGLQKQLRVAEQRLANITDAFSQAGFSEAILRQMQIEEENVARVRAKLAEASGDNRARVLPHAEAIRRYVDKLRAVMDRDHEGATRATLLRHMPPVVITPLPDRGWKLTGAFGLSLQLYDASASHESLGKREKVYEPRSRRDRD